MLGPVTAARAALEIDQRRRGRTLSVGLEVALTRSYPGAETVTVTRTRRPTACLCRRTRSVLEPRVRLPALHR